MRRDRTWRVGRPSPALVVALLALVVALGGVAWSAIPDGSGVIHGCYDASTGDLRVTFTPSRPGDGKFADTALAGIRLRVTDRGAYDPTVTAVHLLAAIRDVHPAELRWNARHFDRLAGSSALRSALESGASPAAAVAGWAGSTAEFRERAAKYLIYR